MRLQGAKGIAFKDGEVIDMQVQINKKIHGIVKLAGEKSKVASPAVLEKILGKEFAIKNLGWSGYPGKTFGGKGNYPLGKGGYIDLGIYKRPEKRSKA